jgi:hypothetical protein
MARIKIKDLPKDMKITKEQMKRIQGGISSEPVYFSPNLKISSEPVYLKISSGPLYMKFW